MLNLTEHYIQRTRREFLNTTACGLGAMALFMLLIALFFVRNRPSNVAMLAALNLILLGTSILEDFI